MGATPLTLFSTLVLAALVCVCLWYNRVRRRQRRMMRSLQTAVRQQVRAA